MSLNTFTPSDFSWVGQTEIWPTKGENFNNQRDALFLRYKEWSKALASQLYISYPVEGMEFEDYMSYAFAGLLESIDGFDPKRGVSFKFYAKKRIRGSILNNIVKYSERINSKFWQGKLIKERLKSIQIEGDTASETDFIGSILNLAIGFILDDKEFATKTNVVDFTAYDSVEIYTLHCQIKEHVDLLPPVNRKLMELHYINARSFAEVASELDLSAGRISQLHQDSLKIIRRKLRW